MCLKIGQKIELSGRLNLSIENYFIIIISTWILLSLNWYRIKEIILDNMQKV